ncbi:nuclease-related domain-containing protein [Pokkaliibacter sp. CJK22405]|uniref:nuclease-related domain-containing protein n=1 Tax=Pokkaliibacter sp. CJK22405 TaxID=3384615 RepID=UPI0039855CEF
MTWLGWLLVFILGFYLGSLRRKYRIRAEEQLVANQVESWIDRSREVLVNNITLELANGKTTQIDHVLISPYGIFVIESKHYSGWIFAQEHDARWTQVLNKKRTPFQNPIRQNYRHVKAIQQLFDFLPPEQIVSLVVFSGSAKFRGGKPLNVFYTHELKNYLRSREKEVMSINRVQFCLGRLQFSRLKESYETDELHISNLQAERRVLQ